MNNSVRATLEAGAGNRERVTLIDGRSETVSRNQCHKATEEREDIKMGKSYIAHCQSGYYGYNRKVHVENPISGHEYAQCGWNREYHEGKMVIQLISYKTIVCELVGQANYALDDWLHCYGTFSQTTRKHIAWFMREMEKVFGYKSELCNYFTAKSAMKRILK